MVPEENDTTETFITAMRKAKDLSLLKEGALVVQTAGTHSGVSGSTDLVKVGVVTSADDCSFF